MNKDLVENIIKFVENYFGNDTTGHDFYHTMRVYKLAREIATKEEADIILTSIIALLHDVDDCKLVGEEGVLLKNTKKILQDNNVDEKKIDLICSEISKISFKGNGVNKPITLEGKIAQDADRIDDLGAIGIARTFTYGGSIGRTIYSPKIPIRDSVSEKDYITNTGTSIGHFYEKKLKLLDLMNTEEGRKLAINRTQYIKDYLDEFFAEWDGTK